VPPREGNLRDLHRRVHAGAYRALPSRRTYIPKADGRQRLLGIAAIEDEIVQAAVVMILTPIYEAEFLGFSYRFRPGPARCAGCARVQDQETQHPLDTRRRYPVVLKPCCMMPSGSWGCLEEPEPPAYHLDTQTFLLAARDVDRGEFAAFETLQHGLA
jgi:hypothetical protein